MEVVESRLISFAVWPTVFHGEFHITSDISSVSGAQLQSVFLVFFLNMGAFHPNTVLDCSSIPPAQ